MALKHWVMPGETPAPTFGSNSINMKSYLTLAATTLMLSVCAFGQSNDLMALVTSSEEGSSLERESVDRDASFPGGTKALKVYLSSEFRMPVKAIENGLEGTVVVRFRIDENGEPGDAVLVQKVHPLVDNEALRVISSMPNWTPGMNHGIPVSDTVEVPFAISLR